MQQQDIIKPLFLNLDSSYDTLKENESPFIKDLQFDIGGNPNQGTGTNNPTGEGQNLLVLTPVRATTEIPGVIRPAGYNLNIGSFYCDNTQELYYFNYNGNGNHGIYIVDGNTLQWTKVIEDSKLGFTDDPEAFIASHRVRMRVVYDRNRNILEKHLVWTAGNKWQGWINVIAAIGSNGFDATAYPYWRLQPPHFDREELLEYPVRPPMIKPVIEAIPNTVADAGKINRIIDKSIQVAYDFIYTDGRYTTASPYSNPLIIRSEDYLNNPDNLPKNAKITFYVGSPMVEKIRIYIRMCGSDWRLYDTIEKYNSCGVNDPEIIGTRYWLRQNQWADFNYNANLNTIEYVFDNSKVSQIIDQASFLRLQTDMPQRSVGMTDLGDAIMLADNRYNYPNFSCDVIDNLDVIVKEKPDESCNVAARTIRLYAYIGRCGDGFNYDSQVGYFLGDDKQMRFGGVIMSTGDKAEIFFNESRTFDLTFGDKDALICYLKGTPYYSIGKWYQVNADNTLLKVESKLDALSDDDKTFIQNVFIAGGYFVCVFDFFVPAGRYIATLGRHNTNLSGNWKNLSTYIMGIANSRIKSSKFNTDDRNLTSIQPNNSGPGGQAALVSVSKEMEIDCTNASIDVWGNGADLFYVYCPYVTDRGNKKFRFIEGYIQESKENPIPVEMFPYSMNHNATDDMGTFTDKNGFYFAYTKVANADDVDMQFQVKLNCAFPTTFIVSTNQSGIGWRPNETVYLSNYNGGHVGDCNRVIINGKITSLDGSIGYSNIAVSIKDGQTVLTRSDGTYELVVHNGQNTLRSSNIYINAGGNFLITIANCGSIPVSNYNEALVPCSNCQQRVYPFQFNIAINIQNLTQTSTKENGTYSVTIHGADLAGRLMFENVIKDISVPSFLERNNLKATYFQILVNNALNLSAYPDIKWAAFSVSKNLSITKYTDWVGDNIKFIDSSGNVVSDPATAVFVSIAIDSLINYNISRNFSPLATYQFVKGDRIRILDDGDGHLFNTSTYGDPIDLQIVGTNYNQAAVNAGILPVSSVENPSQQTIENNQSVTLLVRYDTRLDKLQNKTGFWIELYTPAQSTEQIAYCEAQGFYPIINNRISQFSGFSGGLPQYAFPASIDIDYWDTYFIPRIITIPDIGNKFFSHPFESPNISDDWGAGCTSCGRQLVKNDNVKQVWVPLDTIKSGLFSTEGSLNGLADFKNENRKVFKEAFAWGGIVACYTQGSIVAFICENNFFITDFNFQYIFANAQGIQIANLDDSLSNPHQKIGDDYGCAFDDTGSIFFYDKFAAYYDYKNSAYVLMNYQGAEDISLLFVSSYFNIKTDFIKQWNSEHGKERRFDVISGIDEQRNNIYVTFRNRRNNSNQPYTYANNLRNTRLQASETIVFNLDTKRWVRFQGNTPESYTILKGKQSSSELISFAAGVPNLHSVGNTKFGNYYGQQVTPCLIPVINKQADIVKILQSICIDSNNVNYWIDMIYSNEKNSFSYIPLNRFVKKENMFFAAVLRNMYSYPDPKELFRSLLLDGKRCFGNYFVCRLIYDLNRLGEYSQFNSISYSIAPSSAIKK